MSSRVWNKIPYWCSLCLEPLNDWDNHRGKRDHICLELFFDTIVHTDRLWDPVNVWADVRRNVLDVQEKHFTQPTQRVKFGHIERAQLFNQMFDAYDQNEPALRRREINACLTFLQQEGVVQIDSSCLQQASFFGGVVLFKELFTPLAQMFPHADAKEVSALTQMVYATYNNETVFDLCQLETLIPEALLRERLAISPPTPEGEDGGAGEDLAAMCDNSGETVPYYLKGVFFRALLGSLRWSLEPDTISPPPGLGVDEDRYGVLCTLSAHAMRLLVAELIFCKVSEYVARVEGVFRREGGLDEAIDFQKSTAGKEHRIVPFNSCWGMCQYSGGEGNVFNTCGTGHFQKPSSRRKPN